VVVDRDLKTRGVVLRLGRDFEMISAWCQYDEQICQKLVVGMMGTGLIVVATVGSERNESGKQFAVDGE
jgi:hypothetical protein